MEGDKSNKTIINNNNTYIKNQTLNNIKINNLGNEDVSSISNDEMYKIVDRCYSALKVLTKRTHIDIPENRNIFIPSYKDGCALVHKNNIWQYTDLNYVLENIKNLNLDRINSYFEDNMNNYPEHRKTCINRMLTDSYEGNVDTKYKKDIKMLLLTNRHLLKQQLN